MTNTVERPQSFDRFIHRPDEDPLDPTQSERSRMIGDFLKTVAPGQQYAFLDFDGTVTVAGADVEARALDWLIPTNNWQQLRAQIGEDIDNHKHLVHNRHLTRDAIATTVNDELAQVAGCEAGSVISGDVLRAVGRRVGTQMHENNQIRPAAIEGIQICIANGIQVVILTATPVDIARGVIDSLGTGEEDSWTGDITVLGTEYSYAQDGRITESTWLRGPNKTWVVDAVKKSGGVALVGAGDNLGYSDKFVEGCHLKIDASQPEDQWQLFVDTFGTISQAHVEQQRSR